MEELNVRFLDFDEVSNDDLKIVVIVAKYKDKYIFCRHKDRDTWEIPGGHIEIGESVMQAAKRELAEETGVTESMMKKVCVYDVVRGDKHRCGALMYSDVISISNQLDFEIEEIKFSDELPNQLTYPAIQLPLFDKVISFLETE